VHAILILNTTKELAIVANMNMRIAKIASTGREAENGTEECTTTRKKEICLGS
jgi:hypothetical protein